MAATSPKRTWFFDLDGTLIDSEAAILASFRAALEVMAPEKIQDVHLIKIGPSIQEIGFMLFGANHQAEIDSFLELFKSIYDVSGIANTVAYDGVDELLEYLKSRDQNLVIATNKRGNPTRQLISRFGWDDYFSWTGCLDEAEHPASGKKSVLETYFKKFERDSATIFVGDTVADALVAKHFSMPFIRAAYGYEKNERNWAGVECSEYVNAPMEIKDIAARLDEAPITFVDQKLKLKLKRN